MDSDIDSLGVELKRISELNGQMIMWTRLARIVQKYKEQVPLMLIDEIIAACPDAKTKSSHPI